MRDECDVAFQMTRPLTNREKEILRKVAAGYNHREIAYRLGIKPQSVASVMVDIMNKLDATNSHAAVNIALRRGLISLEEIPVRTIGG